MPTPKGYVDRTYLQTAALLLAPVKQRSYALMQIQSGGKVLDLGCGPGTDTIPLARLVGPCGQVVGLDHDEAMIASANQQALQAGIAEWVTHAQGDSGQLPFASDSFDASRSERLFQHLRDPGRAISELIRVTKRGGWVVVLDTDWGTLSIDATELDIERRLVRFNAECLLHNGYSGRQLYRRLGRVGLAATRLEVYPLLVTDYLLGRHLAALDEVEHQAIAASLLTEEELLRWHASLEATAAENRFFCMVSIVMVAGRKD